MSDAKGIKALMIVATLVLVSALGLRFVGTRSREATPALSPPLAAGARPTDSQARLSRMPLPKPEESTAADDDVEAWRPTITREQVAEHLQQRNRSAASLLAGFHALDDTNLLYEAAARFPNDPQVQWTMLARNLNPDERRLWLDRFKESSPENSLANYLSADNHFKSGQAEAAIKDLQEAAGKPQFKSYAMAAMLDEQELSRFAGQTFHETMQVKGWSEDLVGELSRLKVLAISIGETQQRYLQAGDAQSSAALIQAVLDLSGRLMEGEGGRFILSQQVGVAIEGVLLKYLQSDTKYDLLGGKTAAERRVELTRQNHDFRSLTASFTAAAAALSESDWQSYSDRMKTYGEVEAMRWLLQRAPNQADSGK